jgi:polyribonucleotide nucleotidyltransferase
MRGPLLWFSMVIAATSAASADSISLKISNKTGQAINTIVATPKSGGADISILTAAIAAAATSAITFIQPGTACVFTLTTTLGNGKVISNPDTDLCQTDMLVVQ